MLSKTKITLIIIAILLAGVYYIVSSSYRMDRVKAYFNPAEKKIPHLRAKIITDDNVTLAYSEYVHHLSFLGGAYTKEEFKNLLDAISEVTKIDTATAMKHYFKNSKKEYKIVLYGLNSQSIEKIKTILKQKDSKGKYAFKLSGERRLYPQGDTLTPVIGYTQKLIGKDDFTYLSGVQGLEKSYNNILADTPLVRAQDIYLSIDFKKQRALEKELDELKTLYNAREIISIVLDTDTFYIKAFATSNRYNPKSIKQEDMQNLSPHAIQYLFKLDEFATLVEDLLYLNAKNPEYKIYADLELTESSKVDLPNERIYNNNDINGFENFKVNLIQLLRAYSPFYSQGYIGNPKVVKTQSTDKKLLISKELAIQLRKKADTLFGEMPGKNVALEFEDETVTAAIYMKGFKKDGHNYMQAYFTIFNDYKIPFEVVVHSEVSSSSQYFEATIYSKKDKHKIGTVIQPINRYQAYKRHGSESDIVGVYKSIDGNYYIDALTSKLTMLASCNACQRYNVETFQVTEDGLISKGLRVYDIDYYTPYVECCK